MVMNSLSTGILRVFNNRLLISVLAAESVGKHAGFLMFRSHAQEADQLHDSIIYRMAEPQLMETYHSNVEEVCRHVSVDDRLVAPG